MNEYINLPFGSPKFILNNGDFKFDSKGIEDFDSNQKI